MKSRSSITAYLTLSLSGTRYSRITRLFELITLNLSKKKFEEIFAQSEVKNFHIT